MLTISQLVNSQGRVIEGGENKLLNLGAYMIHHAIHVARPKVNCVAHSHSMWGRAFCTLGRKLDMLTQDFCCFYNDHEIYDDFRGVVKDDFEGRNIAACLGGSKAILMQNHGPLTVGETVEEVSTIRLYEAEP
jgi:ribulose-5-phosphate 4-epimerase/fuculose-1-phosphate aldolase